MSLFFFFFFGDLKYCSMELDLQILGSDCLFRQSLSHLRRHWLDLPENIGQFHSMNVPG